jgi:coenzyme PQQ precursor peptide PqqA
MKWQKPTVREYCVGMEVTSYESAEIEGDTLF